MARHDVIGWKNLHLDIDSIEAFWTREISQLGKSYKHSPTVFFRGQVNTGCGAASSGVGPFYCPADKKVYIDLQFFDELKTQFGATGGAFVNAYVLAHEYGHHIQDLLGVESQIDHTRTGPTSDSVRLELQADCYAGIWGHASEQRKITDDSDVAAGLRAAASVGDDRLQRMATGHVSPETFTHGSSAQRTSWFRRGLQSGDISACETFAER